ETYFWGHFARGNFKGGYFFLKTDGKNQQKIPVAVRYTIKNIFFLIAMDLNQIYARMFKKHLYNVGSMNGINFVIGVAAYD
ncbi:MAG: hypothetical protein FWB79_01900, partial [Treponema sp.]|nr:hypothetical protein [Treponema sp.]